MFHIVVHCKPKKENEEFYGKIIGAFATVLIDYKDYEGVIELSKYYVENNGWEILEIQNEYWTFDKKEDLPNEYQKYIDELKEYGYSLIFNMYDSEDDNIEVEK